jgi:hypothetical protein
VVDYRDSSTAFGSSFFPPFFFFLAPLADEGVSHLKSIAFRFFLLSSTSLMQERSPPPIETFGCSYTHTQCVVTDYYYYPSDFRSDFAERQEGAKDMRSRGEKLLLELLLFFIIDG